MYKLEIKVHTGLDRAKPCIRLWYLAKASSDTGIAKLSLAECAETLDCSQRTIQHYLTEGKRWNYFRDWKREGDKITIYYSSIVTICREHSFQLGYSAFITTDLLPELKQVLAEITAQGLQASSRFAARKEQEELRKQNQNHTSNKLLKPEDYFIDPASDLSPGVQGYYGSKVILLDSSVVHYGASIDGIANNIGRHPQTIKNRLKNAEKIRTAYHSTMNIYEYQILKEEWSEEVALYFTYKNKVYKFHTNIYKPQYQLRTCKRLKSKINDTRDSAITSQV